MKMSLGVDVVKNDVWIFACVSSFRKFQSQPGETLGNYRLKNNYLPKLSRQPDQIWTLELVLHEIEDTKGLFANSVA